jgi:PilZ domain-containing protein
MKQLTAQIGCSKLASSSTNCGRAKAASVGTLTMLQTRSEPRTSQESPVRVFGMDSAGRPINQSGWTVDISQHGARLKGLPFWNGPGETIGIRCGTEKARFRVVWIGKPGTPQEGQVGLFCIETGKFIWGNGAPNSEARPTPASPATMQPGAVQRPPIGTAPPTFGGRNNRRKDARYCANGGAKIQEVGSPAGQWTMMHDISLGGCYVETTSPLRPGVHVEAVVHVGDLQIAARGEITVAHRMVGMGVRFTDMTPLNRQRLESLIDQLIHSGAAEA